MNNRESFAPDISQDNFVPYDYGMEGNLLFLSYIISKLLIDIGMQLW